MLFVVTHGRGTNRRKEILFRGFVSVTPFLGVEYWSVKMAREKLDWANCLLGVIKYNIGSAFVFERAVFRNIM